MIEFDCEACQIHVFGFGRETVPTPPLCASCEMIGEIPKSGDRRRIAEHLLDDEQMQNWTRYDAERAAGAPTP